MRVGFDVFPASQLRIDNLSPLCVANNPEDHGCTKDLDLSITGDAMQDLYWSPDMYDNVSF